MGRTKKLKSAKKAPKAKKKPTPRARKSVAKKKAAPSGTKRAAKTKRPAARKKKAPAARTKRAPRARKPAVRKRSIAPKPAPISKALKKEIATVLVTGATGCVGGSLVQHLLRAGYSVVAADSREPDVPVTAATSSLTVKRGDLADPEFAASCLERVDAVFHPGTHADGKPLYGKPEPSPVNATRTLYAKAREHGVKRFILITSATLYGRHHGPVSEDVALEARDEYEQIQSELESVVMEHALPGLPSVTLIRPAAVYGPGCMSLTASLATLPPLVKTLGPCYIPLSGGPLTSLVHGEDVARAAEFLLLQPKAYGSVYNVADNDPMPFGQLLNKAMESYGLKPLGPGISYPPSTLLQSILPSIQEEEIFNPLGKLSNILWERIVRRHRLSKTLIPRQDQQAVPVGTMDRVVDNRKLMGLGFSLKYPKFQKGWKKTLAWYQKKRWIPGPDEL